MINSIPPKINFNNDQFQGASKLVGLDVDKYVFGKDLSSNPKPLDNGQSTPSGQNNKQNNNKANSAIGAIFLAGLVGGSIALISSLRGDKSIFSKFISKIRAPKP